MKRLFSKIRFLPLTIFAATLMLTIRVGDIWQGVDALLKSSINVSTVRAQTAETPPAAAQPKPAAPAAGAANETASAPAAGEPTTVKEDPGRLIKDDPTLLTPAEIELLQRLAERRDELEKREREINAREGLLKAAESRIERRVVELERLRGVIEERIKVFDEQQEKKLSSLVKIYENMKPGEAARIFEDLEMGT